MNESRRELAVPILLALASVALLVPLWLNLLGRYGLFIDEFYYAACAARPALGYVDHPPLAPWLLAASRAVLGDSPAAIRLLPGLAGAATVFLTGVLARRLGAGPFGQTLAALAVLAAPVLQLMFSMFSMNAFEVLIWVACAWILVEIEQRNEPRLWLAFGAVAGIGLLNKHTMILFALGLAVGLVLTPARRHLRSRWTWLGLAVAAGIFLPNLLWQVQHGFISLEFYRNADLYKNVPTPPLQVFLAQVLTMNPAIVPVWAAGVVFFLATERGRPYRHLGWIFVTLFALMIVGQKSRPDRISAAYPMVLAGGGVLLERLASWRGRRVWRVALAGLVAVGALLVAPVSLPILPPVRAAAYAQAMGMGIQIERGDGKRTALPQWLADRLGWEKYVDDVTRVVATLDPRERSRAVIFTPSYGHAGSLELLGRDLPPVYSNHNNYALWGPPPDPVEVAVVVGNSEERLLELFEQVELAEIHDCEMCMPWRDQLPIWVVRRARVEIGPQWWEWRHLE